MASYGWIILTDYLVQDSWQVMHWVKYGQIEPLRHYNQLYGRCLHYYYHLPFVQLPHSLFLLKLSSVMIHVGSFILLYHLLRLLSFMSKSEVLLVSVFALTMPLFRMVGDPGLFPYCISNFEFMLGFVLALQSERCRGALSIILRLLSLLILSVSFTVESFLVFHYAFLFLWYHCRTPRDHRFDLSLIRSFIIRHLDYLVIPLVNWFCTRTFLPALEVIKGGYDPSFKLHYVWAGVRTLIVDVILGDLNEVLGCLSSSPLIILMVILLAWWIRKKTDPIPPSSNTDPSTRPQYLWVGIVLLVFAILPYIAVGREFSASGWYSRNCLLLPLPLALLLFVCLRLLSEQIPWVRQNFRSIVVILVLGFIVVNIQGIFAWQVMGMKEKALSMAVAQFDPAAEYSIVLVQDRMKVKGTLEVYSDNVLTYAIGSNQENLKQFAFEDTAELRESLNLEESKKYSPDYIRSRMVGTSLDADFTQIDPRGRQLRVRIEPNLLGRNVYELGTQYLLDLYFQPDRVAPYLKKLIKFKFEELKS